MGGGGGGGGELQERRDLGEKDPYVMSNLLPMLQPMLLLLLILLFVCDVVNITVIGAVVIKL